MDFVTANIFQCQASTTPSKQEAPGTVSQLECCTSSVSVTQVNAIKFWAARVLAFGSALMCLRRDKLEALMG